MEVSRRAVGFACLASARYGSVVSLSHVTPVRPSLSVLFLKVSCESIQTRKFRTAASLSREAAPEVRPTGSLAPSQPRDTSKLFKNADEAVADIKSGSVILSAGFGLCGTAGMPQLPPVTLHPLRLYG